MNAYLNNETQRSMADPKRQKIRYEHLRETDRFYAMPKEFLESLPEPVKVVQDRHRHTPRIRVTTDQKTGKIKAAIFKLKVADLEIYCPKDAFDVRISVALEIAYPGPTETLVEQVGKNGDSGSRFKDRLSYKHQFVSVDLTQVTDGGQKKQELELEADTALLIAEGRRSLQEESNYEGLVGIFTNYIRVMNRTCRE
jgi:polynucleotide 5'-triphosphatase